MKHTVHLALAALITLVAWPAQAQTAEDALRFSQRFPATGARLTAMGGAGIAGVADYGALFVNPAGLGYYRSSEVSGALNTFSTHDATVYQTPGFSSLSDRDLRGTRLGNFAYVYKAPTVQGSFVAAVAYNQTHTFDRNFAFNGPNAANALAQSFLPFDDEFEVREDAQGYFPVFFNDVPALAYRAGAIEFLFENVDDGGPLFDPAVAPGTQVDQSGEVLEEGRMSELNFGGAVEASQGVMVGLSANLLFGTYLFDSVFREDDVRGENADYVVLDGDFAYEGLDQITYRTGFTSELTGVNLRAGLSSEVARGLRLGLSLETPTYFSVNEDYFRDLETRFVVGGALGASEEGVFEYEITTPWRFGAGLSFAQQGLMVSADVEYVDWSQLELDAADADFTDVNRAIRTDLEPVVHTRLGGAYRLGDVALRGGFAYQPDPRREAVSLDVPTPDRGRTFYSAGLGYHFSKQFAVDVAWMQERFDDQYVPYGDVASTPPVVEETVKRNRFSVGVRVGF